MNLDNSKLLLIIFLFLCCVLFSCDPKGKNQDNSIQIIKVDIASKHIEHEITIKEVIPLETSNDCLIGQVTKAIFWNNRIIVLDNFISKRMFVFDKTGKKVFGTLKGKGPGEVVDPWAFCINKKDTTILLYERMIRSIKEFDFDWNMISSKVVPNLYLKDFFQIGIDTFLIYHQMPVKISNDETRMTTYSICTDGFNKVKHFDILLTANKVPHTLYSPVDISSEQILFVAPWSYHIYELIGEDYRIKYSLDFGEDALSTDQREYLSSYELVPMVYESNKNKVGFLSSILLNNNLLILFAEYGYNGLTILHSIKNNKTYNLNNYFERGIIPQCIIWGVKEDGCFYALVEPADFIKFNKLSQSYNHLNIDNNNNPIFISFQIEGLN